MLEPVLELMIAAVHRYEGTVNQVMGDGIMALRSLLGELDEALVIGTRAPRSRQALPAHAQAAEGAGAPNHRTTMYREMGMTFWLEKAETESADSL